MARYRIVRDDFAGFEVQIRRWWWPLWCQAGFVNTHATIAEAEEWALAHSKGECGVVKELGKLP